MGIELVIPLLAFSLVAGLAARQAFFSERARARRLLGRAQRIPIASAPEGPVKIAGRLRLTGQSLRAPLSGRTCALYDVQVVEKGRVDKVIIEDRLACDFLVEDGTGTALVRGGASGTGKPGGHLELAIVQDAKYTSGILDDATSELERYLSTFGEKSTGVFTNRNLAYREGAFEPGERVVVFGRARREPDPDASVEGVGYRDRPTRLVIEPLAGKIWLSDDPDVTSGS